MKTRTTFPTVTLDTIRHLLPRDENSDADLLNEIICQRCGHPAADHSLENDTCWHTEQHNGTVKLCNCEGWLFEETVQERAS